MKYSKVVIERDSRGKSMRIGWIVSDDKESLIKALKLHNRVSILLRDDE